MVLLFLVLFIVCLANGYLWLAAMCLFGLLIAGGSHDDGE